MCDASSSPSAAPLRESSCQLPFAASVRGQPVGQEPSGNFREEKSFVVNIFLEFTPLPILAFRPLGDIFASGKGRQSLGETAITQRNV